MAGLQVARDDVPHIIARSHRAQIVLGNPNKLEFSERRALLNRKRTHEDFARVKQWQGLPLLYPLMEFCAAITR